MPLRLSWPQIGAVTNIAELTAPARGGLRIAAFFESETAKLALVSSRMDVESQGIERMPSARLTLAEPMRENQAWLSEVNGNGKTKVVERGIPKLEWPARQDPTLTSAVRRLLTPLWAIVVSRALQVGFPVHKTVVSIFEDPTEQERKAVLRLASSASVSQALAFWDSLEPDLQNWLATLSENDRTTFITKLGLRIHWR